MSDLARRWILSVVALALLAALPGGMREAAAQGATGGVEVRVAAQRLADGRTEFALQEREADGSWAERQLPRSRYFPANARVGRWLASSALTIGAQTDATPTVAVSTGVELRVATRLLADGRMEFAVQEREAGGSWGERRLPRSRYLPADASVGRWLASSVLTVDLADPASGFTLSGTVRDGRTNGLLLAGATVRLENGRPQSTITDQNGQYRFLNVSGAVTATAAAPRFVSEAIEVVVDAERTVDFALTHGGIVPYRGTEFITPDLITPDDPTSFHSVTYVGRGQRDIYDRRPDAWITVGAYLFSARYENAVLELQVNPEFGSREAARQEVDTYAPALGQLPAVLLSRARKVHINAGQQLFGGNWYDRSFLIHTGQGQDYIRDGFVEEIFIHEAGHVSLDGAHAKSAEWRAAQAADGVFISRYARDFPEREDVAESILAYFAVRYLPERLSDTDRALILATIPNRLAYFDEQGLDMSPYEAPRDNHSFPQAVDVSVLEERFIVAGLISGPDGEPLEGIGIWAWQGERENSGYAKTGADGVFDIAAPGGSFTLDVYAGPGCSFVGRYDGAGGITTERGQAFRVTVVDANVVGIEIALPAPPDDLPRIEWCAP